MKRVLLATGGTVAGIAALLSFKSHGHRIGAAGTLPSASLPSSSETTPQGSSSSSTAPTPSRSRSRAAASRTVAGQAIETQYGTVQVQITVAGNKITNASFLQLTATDPRSEEINSYAGPILLQETISAQSAQIDTVSGASYTSAGYLQSLQSALDQAGIR